jgi:hypothetical protein
MPLNVDFTQLVNRVADQFEAKYSMKVNPAARGVLIGEAMPHQRAVQADIARGKITMKFLEDCVMQQLETAREVALEWGRDRIGEDTTRESMKRRCAYAFWC